MKAILAPLLLTLTLVGCLGGSDDAPPTEPPTGTPGTETEIPPDKTPAGNATPLPPALPGPIWGGRTLEAIDCDFDAHNPFADREAINARVPSRASVPGSGPVAIVVVVFDCTALTLGNESLQKAGWIYFAYVTVNDQESELEGHVAYLLEFGSDWDEAWTPLQDLGVPAMGGQFGHADMAGTEQIEFAAPGLAYTFGDMGSGPMPVQWPPAQIRVLAGPEAQTELALTLHRTMADNLPVGGLLQAEGGVLHDLLGPVSPSLASEGEGGMTLRGILQ